MEGVKRQWEVRSEKLEVKVTAHKIWKRREYE